MAVFKLKLTWKVRVSLNTLKPVGARRQKTFKTKLEFPEDWRGDETVAIVDDGLGLSSIWISQERLDIKRKKYNVHEIPTMTKNGQI